MKGITIRNIEERDIQEILDIQSRIELHQSISKR